jgi:hypothetical protein
MLADFDGSGGLHLMDAVHFFNYLLLGGPPHVRGTEPIIIPYAPNVAAPSQSSTTSRLAAGVSEAVTQRDTGSLTDGQVNSLFVKLEAAQRQLDRGNERAATNIVRAFIHHATALLRAGVLPSGASSQSPATSAAAATDAVLETYPGSATSPTGNGETQSLQHVLACELAAARSHRSLRIRAKGADSVLVSEADWEA